MDVEAFTVAALFSIEVALNFHNYRVFPPKEHGGAMSECDDASTTAVANNSD